MPFSSPPPPPPLSPVSIAALLFTYVLISYIVIEFIQKNKDAGDLSSDNHHEHTMEILSSGHHQEHNSDLEGNKGGTSSGLSLEELQKIPGFKYESGQTSCCVICLEGFQHGEQCRLLPACTHVFHVKCVDPWLMRRLTCPMCRTRFKVVDGLEVV